MLAVIDGVVNEDVVRILVSALRSLEAVDDKHGRE